MDAAEQLGAEEVARLHRRVTDPNVKVMTLRNGFRLDTPAKVIEFCLRHTAEQEGRVNHMSAEEFLLDQKRRKQATSN